MGLISLLYKDPVTFVFLAVLLLYSVIAHEVAHGWVAYLFGDDTAKRSGRLTLAPLPHLSLIGTLALFLVGFGWAKPVPVNYARLSHGRFGFFSVSLAGCVTNILIAAVAILLFQFENIRAVPLLERVLPIVVMINVMLGALNLLPIPPLDGSKALLSLLPKKAQLSLARIEPYGFGILIVLILSGLLQPVILFTQNLLITIIILTLKTLHLF